MENDKWTSSCDEIRELIYDMVALVESEMEIIELPLKLEIDADDIVLKKTKKPNSRIKRALDALLFEKPIHYQDPTFSCYECLATFRTSVQCASHNAVFHAGAALHSDFDDAPVVNYDCRICGGKDWDSLSALLAHKLPSTSDATTRRDGGGDSGLLCGVDAGRRRLGIDDHCLCVVCAAAVPRAQLASHYRHIHSQHQVLAPSTKRCYPVPTVDCLWCSTQLKSQNDLLVHISSWHPSAIAMTTPTEQPVVTCGICRTSVLETELRRHVLDVHVNAPQDADEDTMRDLAEDETRRRPRPREEEVQEIEETPQKAPPPAVKRIARRRSCKKASPATVSPPPCAQPRGRQKARKSIQQKESIFDRLSVSVSPPPVVTDGDPVLIDLAETDADDDDHDVCADCQLTFESAAALAMHTVMRVCKRTTNVDCPLCGAKSMNWRLYKHISETHAAEFTTTAANRLHPGLDPDPVVVCNGTDGTAEVPYQCPVCACRFDDLALQRVHVALVHCGDQVVTAGRKGRTITTLPPTVPTDAADGEPVPTTEEAEKDGEPPVKSCALPEGVFHLCLQCGAAFRTEHALKVHCDVLHSASQQLSNALQLALLSSNRDQLLTLPAAHAAMASASSWCSHVDGANGRQTPQEGATQQQPPAKRRRAATAKWKRPSARVIAAATVFEEQKQRQVMNVRREMIRLNSGRCQTLEYGTNACDLTLLHKMPSETLTQTRSFLAGEGPLPSLSGPTTTHPSPPPLPSASPSPPAILGPPPPLQMRPAPERAASPLRYASTGDEGVEPLQHEQRQAAAIRAGSAEEDVLASGAADERLVDCEGGEIPRGYESEVTLGYSRSVSPLPMLSSTAAATPPQLRQQTADAPADLTSAVSRPGTSCASVYTVVSSPLIPPTPVHYSSGGSAAATRHIGNYPLDGSAASATTRHIVGGQYGPGRYLARHSGAGQTRTRMIQHMQPGVSVQTRAQPVPAMVWRQQCQRSTLKTPVYYAPVGFRGGAGHETSAMRGQTDFRQWSTLPLIGATRGAVGGSTMTRPQSYVTIRAPTAAVDPANRHTSSPGLTLQPSLSASFVATNTTTAGHAVSGQHQNSTSRLRLLSTRVSEDAELVYPRALSARPRISTQSGPTTIPAVQCRYTTIQPRATSSDLPRFLSPTSIVARRLRLVSPAVHPPAVTVQNAACAHARTGDTVVGDVGRNEEPLPCLDGNDESVIL